MQHCVHLCDAHLTGGSADGVAEFKLCNAGGGSAFGWRRQCEIASSTSLDFYPEYVPALNTLIVASYRGSGRAVAEVVNSASVASLKSGADNGVRGIVRTMKTPSARTQADCENAALAILDDAGGIGVDGQRTRRGAIFFRAQRPTFSWRRNQR